MKVTVIIPVLYREPQLAETLRGLASVGQRLDLEILLVIDVPDPAREQEARATNGPLAERWGAKPVYRPATSGFGSALRHAFRMATGDVLVPMMADASEDPGDLERLVAALDDGCDVVVGSRYMRGGRVVGNTMKQRMSRLYSAVVRLAGGPQIHDVSNAFKAYRRSVVESVSTMADSFDVSVELTVKSDRAGFRIREIPTTWKNRRQGRSSFVFKRELANYGRWLWFTVRTRRARSANSASDAHVRPE